MNSGLFQVRSVIFLSFRTTLRALLVKSAFLTSGQWQRTIAIGEVDKAKPPRQKIINLSQLGKASRYPFQIPFFFFFSDVFYKYSNTYLEYFKSYPRHATCNMLAFTRKNSIYYILQYVLAHLDNELIFLKRR